jgi:hypothetical protein
MHVATSAGAGGGNGDPSNPSSGRRTGVRPWPRCNSLVSLALPHAASCSFLVLFVSIGTVFSTRDYKCRPGRSDLGPRSGLISVWRPTRKHSHHAEPQGPPRLWMSASVPRDERLFRPKANHLSPSICLQWWRIALGRTLEIRLGC